MSDIDTIIEVLKEHDGGPLALDDLPKLAKMPKARAAAAADESGRLDTFEAGGRLFVRLAGDL